MSEALILPLAKANSAKRALVGGKAASLGEMLNISLPVPPGFVVTTAAFNQGMSPELKQKITQAYKELGAERVAVRSSAVAEDSDVASWAGQLDTYLNQTEASLIGAIEKCWKSIKSDTAIAYAVEHNIQENQQAVAVVVQAMVDSEVSGVLFTANPVTQNKNEVIIEAAYGLGELLVQGLITPENIQVDKATGEVINRQLSKQRKLMKYEQGKNQELPIRASLQGKPIITPSQVKKLNLLASEIEIYYGSPQDIEWAIANGNIYIVQSRPITTLKSNKEQSIDWATTVARRHTPLFLSIAVAGQDSKLIEKQTGLPITFNHVRRKGLAFQFDKQELASARAVVHDAVEKDGLDFFNKYADLCFESCKNLLETAQQISQQAKQPLSPKALAKQLQPYFDCTISHGSHLLVMILVQFELEDFLTAFVKKKVKNAQHANDIIASLKMATERTHEVLNATNLMLLGQLVQETVPDYRKWITADPDELTLWNTNEYSYIWESIGDFTTEFGWMGRMYYAGDPIKPNDVIVRLQNILSDDCAAQLKKIETHREKQLDERKQAIAELGSSKDARLLANTVSRYMYLRTYRLDVFFMAHEQIINSITKAGELLGLAQPYDVIYLTWQEVLAGLSGEVDAQFLQAKILERRDGYEMLSIDGSTKWFALLTDSVSEGELPKAPQNRSLKGATANKGNYLGNVRLVLNDKAMSDMIPGEVLVTTMTTPSLMLAVEKSRAIVTDEGGMLCHAAIVSREFDIPCVIGTETATQLLKTGDKVNVEAAKGLVTVIE